MNSFPTFHWKAIGSSSNENQIDFHLNTFSSTIKWQLIHQRVHLILHIELYSVFIRCRKSYGGIHKLRHAKFGDFKPPLPPMSRCVTSFPTPPWKLCHGFINPLPSHTGKKNLHWKVNFILLRYTLMKKLKRFFFGSWTL